MTKEARLHNVGKTVSSRNVAVKNGQLYVNTLTTWCKEPAHWERPWCWERLRAGGKGGDRGWDGGMALLTQWTLVWANSGRWCKTGKLGVLQAMRSKSWTQLSHWTTCKKMKLDHSLTPNTKISSNWINDLNMRPDIVKLKKENIGRTLSDIDHRNIFYVSTRIMEIKTKVSK